VATCAGVVCCVAHVMRCCDACSAPEVACRVTVDRHPVKSCQVSSLQSLSLPHSSPRATATTWQVGRGSQAEISRIVLYPRNTRSLSPSPSGEDAQWGTGGGGAGAGAGFGAGTGVGVGVGVSSGQGDGSGSRLGARPAIRAPGTQGVVRKRFFSGNVTALRREASILRKARWVRPVRVVCGVCVTHFCEERVPSAMKDVGCVDMYSRGSVMTALLPGTGCLFACVGFFFFFFFFPAALLVDQSLCSRWLQWL
jgi:hypothetical protein